MNQDYLQERLRGHLPENRAIKRQFLEFSSHYFHRKWADLTNDFGRNDLQSAPSHQISLELEEGFVASKGYPEGTPLSVFVSGFGHEGLKNLTALNDTEKNLSITLANYFLATRYQLLDELGDYQGISIDSIATQLEQVNFINVIKVANNLAAKVDSDLQEYVLSKHVELQPQVETEASRTSFPPLENIQPQTTSLHFQVTGGEAASPYGSYRQAESKDISRLNQYAPVIQQTASWYKENLLNAKLTYVIGRQTSQETLILGFSSSFTEKQFLDLLGIRPDTSGKNDITVFEDLVHGRGIFESIQVVPNFNQRLQVLPEIQDMIDSTAITFSDFSQLIGYRTDSPLFVENHDFLKLFKYNEELELSFDRSELSHEFRELANLGQSNASLLGIFRESEGKFKTLSVNPEFVTDSGQELLKVVESESKRLSLPDWLEEFSERWEQGYHYRLFFPIQDDQFEFSTVQAQGIPFSHRRFSFRYFNESKGFPEQVEDDAWFDFRTKEIHYGSRFNEISSEMQLFVTRYLTEMKAYVESYEIEQSLPLATERFEKVDSERFTLVLDSVYNVGAVPLESIPREFLVEWEKYYDLRKKYGEDFEKVVIAAEGLGILNKDSDFYQEYLADQLRSRSQPTEIAEVLSDDITFVPEDGGLTAYFDGQKVSHLSKDKKRENFAAYNDLKVRLKYQIITEFSDFNPEVKPKEKELSEPEQLHLSRIVLEYSELPGTAENLSFEGFNDLQSYLSEHFKIPKERLEGWLDYGSDYYDKTKLRYEFSVAEASEPSYSVTQRLDLGLNSHDFNPYLDLIQDTFQRDFAETIRDNNLTWEASQEAILPTVELDDYTQYLLLEEGNNFSIISGNIYEIYSEISSHDVTKEEFPIIEGYLSHVTAPSDLLEKVKMVVDVGDSITVLESGTYFNKNLVIDQITEEADRVFVNLLRPDGAGYYSIEVSQFSDVIGGRFVVAEKSNQFVEESTVDEISGMVEAAAPEEKSELDKLKEIYPIGSFATYKGENFKVTEVDGSGTSYSVELSNEFLGGMITMNPIVFGTFKSIQEVIKVAEPTIEKVKTDDKISSKESVIEPNLFVDLNESTVSDEEASSHQEVLDKVDQAEKKFEDFTFPEDTSSFYPRTPSEKVAANIEAIRLVKILDKEERQASPKEQEILAKYVGWGGLANDFFNEHNQRFASQRSDLKGLVTKEEYRTMRESSLTAYYTDPEIVRSMWQKLVDDGFTGGRILDPSMGTGNFFASMPKEIRENSELYGVELDSVTGAIARQLNPNAKIQIKGFEETNFNDGAFDLVISNIPFANIRISDNRYDRPYLIHDYFVKRSMDLLRDGGQLSIISSTGTMDKRTGNVLRDIESITQFIGGARLPDTAFKRIAGTSVTTDILYFQKDEQKELHEPLRFTELAFEPAVRLPADERIWGNPYFLKYTELLKSNRFDSAVLGEFEVKNFNGGTLSVRDTSSNFIEDLRVFQKTLPKPLKIPVSSLPPVEKRIVSQQSVPEGLSEKMSLYSFAYEGDTIYYRDNLSIRIGSKIDDISYFVDKEGNFKDWAISLSQSAQDKLKELNITEDTALEVYTSEEPASRGKNKGYYKKTLFYESPLTDREVGRIKGMVDIRDAYQAVIAIQRDYEYDKEEFSRLLVTLNEVYDKFVKNYGYINASINRNLFEVDDKYSLLASLEDEYINDDTKKIEYKKSLAFEQALVRPERTLTEVFSAVDALNSSIADGRGVDFDYMATIYKGKTSLDMIEELDDLIIPDPVKIDQDPLAYLPRNIFLSGDILTKIEQIDQLIESGNQEHDWSKYKTMLEGVKPDKVMLTDIDYKIGSRWIPEKVYAMFARNTFGATGLRVDDVNSEQLNNMFNISSLDNKITFTRSALSNFGLSPQTWSLGVADTRYNTGVKIFENLLNSNLPTITKKAFDLEGKEKQVTDVVKTAELRAKEAEIQGLFKEFIESNPQLQTMLEDSYNNLYNRTVTRNYDGSHLEIDGLASNINLRPHQKAAIQRIVEDKRALLAHEVGSGKTLTMLGAGFKLKELGMANKPLYVVPSSLTAQFGQEIMKFFPTKNVFVTTKKDFIKANRKQFVSRIITGDYDAIVIGDSQFEKIPMSKEKQELYLNDKLEALRELLENSTEDRGTVKQIEASIQGFEAQLKKLQEIKQDSFIEFENLGIDFLFVDEAHHFKNLRPITNLGNVAGITNRTSKKNIDMEMKVRQVQSEHGNTNVVFATGTPVSNSISELYTMMNYVQPDVLERYQVKHFDAWVGAFGNIENAMELSPTGDKYQAKKRFKKFVNLPELIKIYKETADVQTSDMLALPVPEYRLIPVESELTASQEEYLDSLVERSDLIKQGQVDPSEDNMLKITSEARKLAIDMRLIDPAYDFSDNNKLLQVVDNVERIYLEGNENKVTQMIFSDIGTPKSSVETFDVYNELKRLLVERGIPMEEIAFVHDANTDEKRNSLSRKVNAGEVRVLLASTEKGGTGLNVQRKMKAVHHLDVPWRPSDLTQRNGRLIRQGNENKEVEIYHYITKGSFDNFLWETQKKKLKYITQIMTSKDPVRSADDIDEQTMTAADFKALATGNPYLKTKMELENQLHSLENQRRAFLRNRDNARDSLAHAEEQLPGLREKLSKIGADIEKSRVSKEQEFSMVLKGQRFDEGKKAGEALHEMLSNNVSEKSDKGEVTVLGQYRGFTLTAQATIASSAIYDFGEELLRQTYTIMVEGDNSYPVKLDLASEVGSIRRINNVIDDIEKEASKTERRIENYEMTIKVSQDVLAKTFPEENYQRVKAKYDVLAPLIEAGESQERIEEVLTDFLYREKQSLQVEQTKLDF